MLKKDFMKWFIAVALLSIVTFQMGCVDQSESPSAEKEEDEGIQIRIDQGEWTRMEGTAQKVGDREYTLHAYSGAQEFTAISWKSSHPVGKFRWSFIANGPIEGNIFQCKQERNIDYFSFYIETQEAMDSPGAITVTEFGEVGEYVTGKFVIERASKVNDASGVKIGVVKIEGTFRVKRSA
jgi:hypothetical protein